MTSDQLTLFELLAPTALVLGAIYLLRTGMPIENPWTRRLVFGLVWIVVAWYLQWRLTVTVLPADGPWYETAWIWFCFAVETLAIFDQLILYIAFLRTTNHSKAADRHEARLRAMPKEQLPTVDVFIPTYNEPYEVLEKTITGRALPRLPQRQGLGAGRRPPPMAQRLLRAEGRRLSSTGPTTRTPRPATSTTP